MSNMYKNCIQDIYQKNSLYRQKKFLKKINEKEVEGLSIFYRFFGIIRVYDDRKVILWLSEQK